MWIVKTLLERHHLAARALGSTAIVAAMGAASTGPACAHDPWEFFQNRVFDEEPTDIYPDPAFTPNVDDTARVQAALNAAALEDPDGGVVRLHRAQGDTPNRYRLGTIYVPSNIRIEIDPAVTLTMNADPEVPAGSPRRDPTGTFDRNRYIFAVGVTPRFYADGSPRARATVSLAENVEIRSMVPGERYTIDISAEYPLEYYFRENAYARPQMQVAVREDGQNEVFAAPFVFGYVRNFRVADADIIDNDTVLPSVWIYPDTDLQSGSLRFVDPRLPEERAEPLTDPEGTPIDDGDLIDRDGTVLRHDEPVVRNRAWGRTASNGTVENIHTVNSHTGYGLVQVYGGEDILLRDLHGEGGITVRLEPGSGTDNMNRAGPMLSRIARIEVDNISNTNGFTALWMNPHGKRNTDIRARNIRAYDSGSAILIEKSTVCDDCRDLERGSFTNVELSGEVLLARTSEEPRAEIGYVSTFFIAPELRAAVIDRNGVAADGHATGEPDGRITTADLPHPPSGRRWYITEPIAPILALSQLAADNIGRLDLDGDGTPDLAEDRPDYYAIDFSNVTIRREGNIRRSDDILYREDMVDFASQNRAADWIAD